MSALQLAQYQPQLLPSAANYARAYASKTFHSAYGDDQQPIFVQSLTDYVSEDIYNELISISNAITNIQNINTYGVNTISTYSLSMDILTSKLTIAMTNVTNSIKSLLEMVMVYNQPLQTVTTILNNIVIFVILVGLVIMAVVPFFGSFYYYANRFDEQKWMIRIMRIINMLLSFFGFMLIVLFSFLLFASVVVTAFCFFADRLIVLQNDFLKTYQTTIKIPNPNVVLLLNNCFNQNTADFNAFATSQSSSGSSASSGPSL